MSNIKKLFQLLFAAVLVKKFFSVIQAKQRETYLAALANRKRSERDARREILRKLLQVDPDLQSRICRMTAVELLDNMRKLTLSCEDVVKCFASRALAVGELTNCVTEEAYDEALMEARKVDAFRNSAAYHASLELPLLGLPFSVKDNINMAGYDSTCGTAARCFAPAKHDAAVVALWKRAGGIPFVRTNVPQALLVPESSNRIWGRSLNPWNLSRTTGGSSGGEAGVLGANASPLGIGTDIGGSLRGPAFNCGVCALKPSNGRISRVGIPAPRVNGTTKEQGLNGQEAVPSVVGPMARCVDDLVLGFRAWLVPAMVTDFDYSVPPPAFNDKAFIGDAKSLRIGVFVSDPAFPAMPACRRAVREAAAALAAAGHTLVEVGSDPFLVSQASPAGHAASASLPGPVEAFVHFVNLLGADGNMRSLRDGLLGEALIDDYKLLYAMSLVPNWLRSPLAWSLSHLGRKRSAVLLQAARKKSAFEFWNAIADRVGYTKVNIVNNHNIIIRIIMIMITITMMIIIMIKEIIILTQ